VVPGAGDADFGHFFCAREKQLSRHARVFQIIGVCAGKAGPPGACSGCLDTLLDGSKYRDEIL
jgi:hypothetical protein